MALTSCAYPGDELGKQVKNKVLFCLPTARMYLCTETKSHLLPHFRFVTPQYLPEFISPGDHLFTPQPDGCGVQSRDFLPNPRLVSAEFHGDKCRTDVRLSSLVVQFGQILDHDITLTPEGDEEAPISILPSDYFHSNLNPPQTQLPFHRSTRYCETYTTIREQVNDITAYVDASMVYGSDDATQISLRQLTGGLLKHELVAGKELLPHINGERVAGDVRGLENPGLASYHTIFLREHNRIARKIALLRPYWSDEEIFQEARRILIAEWQNIVYRGYLPLILGPHVIKTYNLDVSKRSYYSPETDASIVNSFATAAFRYW